MAISIVRSYDIVISILIQINYFQNSTFNIINKVLIKRFRSIILKPYYFFTSIIEPTYKVKITIFIQINDGR